MPTTGYMSLEIYIFDNNYRTK